MFGVLFFLFSCFYKKKNISAQLLLAWLQKALQFIYVHTICHNY